MNANLFATTRHSSIPESKDIFGKFIGKWSLDLTIINTNGTKLSYTGEWHFHRILQGRAIQDIWMVPGLTGQNHSEFHEYGTTIRTFNTNTNTWKAVWFGPIQNQLFVFDVEDKIDQIVLTQVNNPIWDMKWIFFDISSTTFKWKSEIKAKEHND